MFQSLQEPKRLIGYSKFSTTHYASEGDLLQKSQKRDIVIEG